MTVRTGGCVQRLTKVANSLSMKTSLCSAPAPTARRRGHDASSGLVPLVPQRPDLGDEFSEDVGRQSGDPLAADDGCTCPFPHHTNQDQGSSWHLRTWVGSSTRLS